MGTVNNRRPSKVTRYMTTGMIVACVVVVGWMVFATFYFQKDVVAARSLDNIAKDYYENYFYERFLGGREASAEVFKNHTEHGFTDVKLRQLLSFDRSRNAKYADDFEICDKKNSWIRIKPVAPFGKKDYTIETKLDCGNK